MKCPLSAPAKPSKPRIPRLVGVSCSISQKICDQQSNIRPGSKVGSIPVAKTRQVAAKYMTTPRNKKCLAKRNWYKIGQDMNQSQLSFKKLVPGNLEDFTKNIADVGEIPPESSKQDTECSEDIKEPLKKVDYHFLLRDRVKYVGPSVLVEEDNRPLGTGQRGEIYEISGERVAVILDSTEDNDQSAKPSIYWLLAKHVERDIDTEAEDCYIAMQALSDVAYMLLFVVLKSVQPLIVYFPYSSLWLSRAVSKSNRKEFMNRLQEMFNQI
ncbi:unnamed protein product [Lactuca virosa]|uniref:Uncharacterized protein n=1 Tax=Lactuca virosa TaxID=75947 RepID=A0AAU9LHJ6_9ASTR|nr:unnamed protein product [Lactuca virosa]